MNVAGAGVRSEAVQLAIGLAKFSAKYEKVPAALSVDQERTIRGVLELGLTKKATKLAESLLFDEEFERRRKSARLRYCLFSAVENRVNLKPCHSGPAA